jgi:hypothetical protein
MRDTAHFRDVASVSEGCQQLRQGLLALTLDDEVDRLARFLENLAPHEGCVDAAHHGARAERLGGLHDLQAVGIGGGDAGGRDDVGFFRLDGAGDLRVRRVQAHRVVDFAVEPRLAHAAGEVDEVERDPAPGHLDDSTVIRRRDEENLGHETLPLRVSVSGATSLSGVERDITA